MVKKVYADIDLSKGWDSLRKEELRIDYMRGIVASEKYLIPIVKEGYLTTSTDSREGILKLTYNHIDVFVQGNVVI